jgi:adenine-specific DNA-methyltransferase
MAARSQRENRAAIISSRSKIQMTEARSVARAWSTTVSDASRIKRAAAFTRAAMESYAASTAPRLQLGAFQGETSSPLDGEAATVAACIGREASAIPAIEALHYLTSLYPALLPQKHRSAVGAFYTPPCLSERLLDLATEAGLDWSCARVLDPAAGGGAFLLQAALRMRRALPKGEPAFILAQIGTRLLGLELDEHAARLAQASLEIALADLTLASGRPLPSVVRVCDTIEEGPVANFDLVVGNPPYGRVTLTATQRERFARSLYGHANLYGVFTDIAIRWAKPNGLIAYLTPTSMLGGQYFAALRSLLAKEAPPVAMDFVQARRGVFEDVLQETLLTLYRRGVTPGRLQVHYLKVRNETTAEVVRNGTVGLPQDSKSPWLAPRDPKHCALIAHVETMPTRLSDWGYEVSTGPLVWNRFKRQLRDKPGHDIFPLIWAEAVTADGRFIYRAEKRNHAPYFKLESGNAWLLVEEGCVLLQRTTAKEQPRRLIAAEMPEAFVVGYGGVVVENHLNMVRAKEPPKVSVRALAAVLNSQAADQVFRCISGSVAVSAFELESLPLPTAQAMQPVERLLAGGAAPVKVEAAIAALYGQTDA